MSTNLRIRGVITATLLGSFALLSAVPSAQAVVLTAPSGNVSMSGVTDATAYALTDQLAYGTQVVTRDTFSGTARFAVYKDTLTGGLDFLYQFTNAPGALHSDPLSQFTMVDFTGFTTDVYYRTDAVSGQFGNFLAASSNGGESPDQARRNTPNTVGFDFQATLPALQTGSTSAVVIIKTNATQFHAGQFTVQDGDVVALAAYAPGPEPSSIVLFGTMLFGVSIFVRKKLTA